jgi:Cof subfamily protein (haloacid dehalogenase superfamily)
MLVAIDLDGTLIGESLVISDEDRAAIAGAVGNGYEICLASGRLLAASRPYAQELGLRGPIIVLQGAVAYDLRSEERLFCTPLPSDTALVAYDDLKERGFHLQLYFGDRLYLDELNERANYYLKLSRVEPVMVDDLRVLLTGAPPPDPGPIKVLAIAEPDQVNATIPQLAQRLGSKANVFKSLPRFLEATHPDANKGYALRKIAAHLGIDMSNTVAIGDSDNDIPMFQAASRSFAVASGTVAAKHAAQGIVPELGIGVSYALRLLEEEQAHEPA